MRYLLFLLTLAASAAPPNLIFTVYEGGIRVPLLVRWPGKIAAGSISDHPSTHRDALATLAEIAGAEVAHDHDGISYLPELLGKPQPEHEALVWDYAEAGGQIAIRMGEWKLLRRDLKNNPDSPAELYDLASDPDESENLAEQHPDIVARLEKRFLAKREMPEAESFRFWKYE